MKRVNILVLLGVLAAAGTVLAVTTSVTPSVTVGNAAPTVTAVSVNGGTAITLTANATTAISVNATITDNNGCGDISGGTTTILLYRNGVGSSTCSSTADNLNCYSATAFNVTSSCSTTNINTTTTFGIYYFAQATDASSSFSGQGWRATVKFTDPPGATSTADSATTTLNSLTAINVTTSSINYGTLAASSTTGGTNQTTTLTNAGNSSTTLNLSGTALNSGSNHIATSSQHYATSSFTFGGAETALTDSAVSVTGFTLVGPTSTNNVNGTIFWGLTVPGGSATGTYTGTSTYTAIFSS